MEFWVDASHASKGKNKTVSNDSNSATPRMRYIIMYSDFPLHWLSTMQAEIALSST
jgi:hypothetical protein